MNLRAQTAAATLLCYSLTSIIGQPAPLPPGKGEPYHRHRLLVTYRNASDVSTLSALHGKHATRVDHLPRTKLHVVTLVDTMDPITVARRYIESGIVEAAEPDYVRELNLSPNDPRYVDGTLWGLQNEGQNGGVADADIDAPEAWETLSSAEEIVVAILDTGIRPSHEDLGLNIWTNASAGGYGWNALTRTGYPADDEGHGCLVSGILGGVGNNGKGITGVSWKVRLMACKCFNSQRLGYDSDIISCIEFARTNGARIINASLGAYAYSQALSNAICAARQDGIIFVAACGNDGRNIDLQPYYPASYPIDNIVSVGFSTRSDAPGSISNYGTNNVHLMAPGAAMYSTFFASDSSYLGGAFLAGTSLAAPHVSGALALALSRYPGEPHAWTIDRLLAATDPVGALQGSCKTGGRLNLQNLLNPPILLSITPAGTDCIIQGKTSPHRMCVIELSSDLHAWSAIGGQISGRDGKFRFTHFGVGSAPRFYRALSTM